MEQRESAAGRADKALDVDMTTMWETINNMIECDERRLDSFYCDDEAEESWRIVEPILEAGAPGAGTSA